MHKIIVKVIADIVSFILYGLVIISLPVIIPCCIVGAIFERIKNNKKYL